MLNVNDNQYIKTDKFALDEYSTAVLNDNVYIINTEVKYNNSKLIKGVQSLEIKKWKKVILEEKKILINSIYNIIINIGQIINENEIIAKDSHGNVIISDCKMRLISIRNIEDSLECTFQILDNYTCAIELNDIHYIDMNNVNAIYYDALNTEKKLNITSIYINDNYNLEIKLDGFDFDDKILSGIQYKIIITVSQNYESFFIDKCYLFYDESIDKYYLKKCISSAKYGNCYIKEYINNFYIENEKCFIYDDMNSSAIYTDYLY